MRSVLMIILLTAALLGCREDIPPIVSGNVVDGGLFMGTFVLARTGHPAKEWELTKPQIDQVNLWLQSHRDGWQTIVASPPPPSFSILLIHADKTQSRVDLFDINNNWREAMVIHAANASNNGIRHISVQEREELLAIVGKNP
jgi:hypothetical protein